MLGKITTLSILTALFAAGLVLARTPSQLIDEAVTLETKQIHSRLIVRADKTIDVEWKETKTGFEILLKGASPLDLGIPFGSEKLWKKSLARLKDHRLKHVSFKEVKEGLKITGKWKFARGDHAPARPEMKHFLYHSGKPSRVVLDFWPKPGLSIAQARSRERELKQKEALARARSIAKRRADRRLAMLKRQQEAADLGKFCRRPLSDESDVFLPFAPVHDEVEFSKWFPSTIADRFYPYLTPTSEEKDAQYFRLAQQLYAQGKPALVIRTIDFFDKEIPESPLRYEMKFLRANALIKLGQQARADSMLKELIAEVPDKPVSLHSQMYIAAKRIERKEWLLALESFLWLTTHYPSHRLNWVFQLGVAESFYSLKQTERAAKSYQWVVENAPDREAQAEAAFRIGDLYLVRRQYPQALAAYYKALKHFKDLQHKFAAIHLNRAESLYWLKQYDRSERGFQKFLTLFTGNPNGWRATYRLAEISGRKKNQTKQYRDFLYETINQFPFSPGATLSRLRLLPCGDHGKFTVASAAKFFATEAKNFDSNGEIVMHHYKDLKSLAHVRSLITMGEAGRAVFHASQYLKDQMQDSTLEILSTTFKFALRKQVLELLNEGMDYDALAFYNQFEKDIPRRGSAVIPDYLLKLAQAANELGLGSLGKKLMNVYAVESTGFHDLRAIAAVGEGDIDEEVKNSEVFFTEAKSLWITSPEKNKEEVKKLLDKVVEESPFSYQREIILGLLSETEEKYQDALRHATKAQILATQSYDRQRLKAWIANLHEKAGVSESALEILRGLEEEESLAHESELDALGVPPYPTKYSLFLREAEILEKDRKWGRVAGTLGRAIENGHEDNRILFSYARALRKTGDEKDFAKAYRVFKKVAGSEKKDFWTKLAQDALANEKSRTN